MDSNLSESEMIRLMRVGEVEQLLDWAGSEGWNPGIHDAQSFWKLDREGFLAIVHHDQVLGGGAIIRHSARFGFMGLFIVNSSDRGRGLGTKLWFARRDRLLMRLQEGATIGLDGVDAMVPFYAKGGFQPHTRHRRFQLARPATGFLRSEHIVEIASVSQAMLADYDSQCFPARRESFLADWTTQTNAVSLAYVKGDQLLGYGVMRPCLVGWKVGPLFADTLNVADELFQAFQLACQGLPIFLDVPDNHPAAIGLCQKYHMQEVFGCVRMYHGPAPPLDHQRIFGVTTLEVG